MQQLEAPCGHHFRDKTLLKKALTHPSLGKFTNNQRLEFLGDSVLGACVAGLIYTLYPSESEGNLARRQAALVRSETLAFVARQIGLGAHMLMGKCEEQNGGRDNPTNLEDACEALIGALYVDGGFEVARKFVHTYWLPLAKQQSEAPKDAKTTLQEWAQGRGLPVPDYRLVESSGPAHAPQFTIEVVLPGLTPQRASANGKRRAEQLAAEQFLNAVAGLK